MTYTFVNISAIKFSINGRELFKTFIPFYVNDNMIKILNIYDSSCPLVNNTLVTDFVVDDLTYTNAKELSNAIHDVIFSRNVEGEVNNAQIEINRLAIIDLQNDKADVDHNHNDLYYTKPEIDAKINSIVNTSDLLNSGEVDGNKINFRDGDGVIVFSVDADAFLAQGTSVDFDNGVLKLKNSSGATISATNIEAKESYYDIFKFVSGVEDDLTDLIPTDPFTLVKTTSGLYFFVSKIDNKEDFINTRIYNRNVDTFFNLNFPTVEKSEFKAWQLTIPVEAFINNNQYKFDFWIQKASNKEAGIGITDNLDTFNLGATLPDGEEVILKLGNNLPGIPGAPSTINLLDQNDKGVRLLNGTLLIDSDRLAIGSSRTGLVQVVSSGVQILGKSLKINPDNITPSKGGVLGFVNDNDGTIGIVEPKVKDEESSFSPVLIDIGGGATYNASGVYGRYFKINKMVHIYIDFSSIIMTGTPTGRLRINGLPFSTDTALYDNLKINGLIGSNLDYTLTDASVRTQSGENYIGFFRRNVLAGTGYSEISNVTFPTSGFGGKITITGTYFTNL